MDAPKPEIRLDLWHAKHRLLEVARKTHGAYPAFSNSLTEAFTIEDPRAMKELQESVARLHPKWEPWEVQQFLRRNYGLVLKHVPRLIPPPDILAQRYQAVIKLYRGIPDIVTGELYSRLFLTWCPCC